MYAIKQIVKKYLKNFTFFYQKLRYRIFIVIIFNILSGVMDGFGLTMFLPLFEIAANMEAKKPTAGGSQKVMDFFNLFHIPFNLLTILLLMVFFFALKGVFTYFRSLYDAKVAKYFIITTREEQLSAFSNIKFEYFVKSDVGRIQNLLSVEVNNTLQGFKDYTNLLQFGIMVLVYMSFAFVMNPQFCILIIIGGLIFNFLFKRIYKLTKESSRKIVAAGNDYSGMLVQLVANYKYLKATGLLRKYVTNIRESIFRIENLNFRMAKLNSFTLAIREPVLILIISTVIFIQVYWLHGSLSTIIVSLLFFYRALTNVTFLQMTYNYFIQKIGSMENVADFNIELNEHKEEIGTIPFKHFTQQLQLNNLTFAYGDKAILKNINLAIHRNNTIAFVGESGSGKTTLVNILAGLLTANGDNTYLVDNQSINSLDLVTFQQRIGYISQEPVIFSDTLFNNVTLWADPTPENITKFKEILNKASLSTFVDELELKEKTLLGNNGINLSGGQKQRVSIARELYKDVDILILDEATSALDSETERYIQENIDALKGKYTILIVAHRLATIKNADKVVLMSKGEILDIDSFDELKEKSPKFKRMVDLQEI